MANTPNYSLYKPSRTDNTVDVDTSLANNFTTIDTEIKNRKDEIDDHIAGTNGQHTSEAILHADGSVKATLDNHEERLGNAETELTDHEGRLTDIETLGIDKLAPDLEGRLSTVENDVEGFLAPATMDGMSQQGYTFDEYRIGYVDNKLAPINEQLADKTTFVSIKTYSNLKVAIAEGYDWSPAIAQAITDAQSTKKKIVLHADEDMYITQPIVPNVTTKIVGFGKYNSKIKLKGAIKGIDLSSTTAKTGVEISSISIEGTSTAGQIGIDAYYLVNGSSLRDIRIENVDVGLRVTKSWYASFSDIRILNGLSYGLHVRSLSTTEQVNAISFKSIFIQGFMNNVFLDGVNVASAVKFDSCTFEQSKKTSVISNGFSPLKFENCYFESNYTDATTTDTLTWQKPIDVKVTGTSVRNLVKFDSCYFARKNNFLTSSQKTSIYLGTDAKGAFDNCQFVCNTGGYIDANIYSDSQYPASIRNVSEDGYATNMYTGALKEEVIFCDPDYNLRYTSTLNNAFGVIVKDANYYVKFIPRATATVAEQATAKLQMLSDNTVIGSTLTFPTSFTKDTPIEFNMGRIIPTKAVNVVGYTATTTDLIGALYLVRKYYD